MEVNKGLIVLVIVSLVGLAVAQWTPDPTCPYPSNVTTRYPYYGNCSLYWECYQGTKYVMECPNGLEFNANKSQCDDPTIANCDPYQTTTPFTTRHTSSDNPDTTTTQKPNSTTTGTTDGWTPDPLCPWPSDSVVYFPYPGDCTKYYECWQGNKYLYQCPDNLWWNQALYICDYPEHVDCDDSNSTTTTSSSTTSNGTTTTKPTNGPTTTTSSTTTDDNSDPRCIDGNTSYWPHPADCSKYIECFEGHSYTMNCPSGFYFSESAKRCVTAAESECCQTNGGCDSSLIKWFLKLI